MWKLLCFLNTDPAFSRVPWTRHLSKCATLANLSLKPAPLCFCMHVSMSSARKHAHTDDFQARCAYSVSPWLLCVSEEKKRKENGDLLDSAVLLVLACRRLTGFYNFLWLIGFSFQISNTLLYAGARTRVQSVKSEEGGKDPFLSVARSNSRLHFQQSFYIGEMTKLWLIIWMIADDHWGATLKFEKWDWLNLMITWVIAFSNDSLLIWDVNEPVFNWFQNSPFSFMHTSPTCPLSHGLIPWKNSSDVASTLKLSICKSKGHQVWMVWVRCTPVTLASCASSAGNFKNTEIKLGLWEIWQENAFLTESC